MDLLRPRPRCCPHAPGPATPCLKPTSPRIIEILQQSFTIPIRPCFLHNLYPTAIPHSSLQDHGSHAACTGKFGSNFDEGAMARLFLGRLRKDAKRRKITEEARSCWKLPGSTSRLQSSHQSCRLQSLEGAPEEGLYQLFKEILHTIPSI